MDKASDFGSEDCRFESCHGRVFLFLIVSDGIWKFGSSKKTGLPWVDDLLVEYDPTGKVYGRFIKYISDCT